MPNKKKVTGDIRYGNAALIKGASNAYSKATKSAQKPTPKKPVKGALRRAMKKK